MATGTMRSTAARRKTDPTSESTGAVTGSEVEALTVTRSEVAFESQGVPCAAWHYQAELPSTEPSARPCVVMAHGFGGTRDTGLHGFAERFARAGVDALVFDYRTFGASGGEPRQLVDIPAQVADYEAAVAVVRGLEGVDPDRVALWGVSLSAGHVLRVAAGDGRIAAVVALTPVTDGRATARAALKRSGLAPVLASLPGAAVAAVRRSGPVYAPVAGRPGENAAVNAPGAYEAYTGMAGETWQNRYTVTNPLQLGSYRPGRDADRVACPVLVQIADHDQSAPPLAAAQDARRLPAAEVRHYPCDHFDVYTGASWHDQVVAHQVSFLGRHLVRGGRA